MRFAQIGKEETKTKGEWIMKKEKRVRALVDILLDRMGPGQKLEKGETCTVEEVIENLIILRRETGESCMVELSDFERHFRAEE